ncbi:MAG: hypothetical protein A3H93_12130 [Rhodocyclales bacterium RIFCSPLOWO2_02_FULL_63_24]|nr:MAG: hypothetical protein A3H93_12130 [Rhodocyclales bacterium RIFCSPLOWO2_02_FULL_63_24]
MRQVFACLLCALLMASAQAEDTSQASAATAAAAALEVVPQRTGYAFAQPEILLRQRLFGLAHGLSLLAAACLDLPGYSQAIQDAYAAWHARQGKAIDTIVHDLAAYYFGPRAGEAQWPDLSRALNLADNIQPALSEITLHAACASLPEAIARPRYALDKLLAGSAEPETPPNGVAAAAPAPTMQKPAE